MTIADRCAAEAADRLFDRVPALAALRGHARDQVRDLCIETIADAIEDIAMAEFPAAPEAAAGAAA